MTGETGTAGAAGAAGATGPQGVAGLANVTYVTGQARALPLNVASPNQRVNVSCPTGMVALSGGAVMSQVGQYVVLSNPLVDTNGQPRGWTSWVTPVAPDTLTMVITATPFAVCAFAQ